MPTTNPEKNREYVKKSNEKKKSLVGEEEYKDTLQRMKELIELIRRRQQELKNIGSNKRNT